MEGQTGPWCHPPFRSYRFFHHRSVLVWFCFLSYPVRVGGGYPYTHTHIHTLFNVIIKEKERTRRLLSLFFLFFLSMGKSTSPFLCQPQLSTTRSSIALSFCCCSVCRWMRASNRRRRGFRTVMGCGHDKVSAETPKKKRAPTK